VRHTNSRNRELLFLLVTILHFALIYIFLVLPPYKSKARFGEQPLSLFVVTEAPQPKLRVRADPSGPQVTRTSEPLSRLRLIKSELAQPPSVDTVEPTMQPDWDLEAIVTANTIAQRTENKGGETVFGKRDGVEREGGKASIFDPTSQRRAGTWEDPFTFYATDNCHFDFDPYARLPTTALDNRLKTAVCKHPPRGGGDTMFKDLTPNYLRQRQ
jgi:hypothetical protein